MTIKALLVLDVGATNVKACLVDPAGLVLASFSMPNETVPDPEFSGGRVWDTDDIWAKLGKCCRQAIAAAGNVELAGVTVTTFGVDGAFVCADGSLGYPVISWQCTRTVDIENRIEKYFNRDWLYSVTGLQSYHFNTIHKLIWYKEFRDEVLKRGDQYVLMPSLILYRLCGERVTDTTMAGTTMLTNLKARSFSAEIFDALGLLSSAFPPLVEPGTVVGKTTSAAAESLGIPAGIPVLAAGHDTQFALLAAGAGVNEPVLSSGTWEILMVRTPGSALKMPDRQSGITIELDAQKGLVNPGIQWVASGVLEWFAALLYPETDASAGKYESMIKEAACEKPGSGGVRVNPELFGKGLWGGDGSIRGLTQMTTRGQIYRAAIESMCYSLRLALDKLGAAGVHPAGSLICVGGGAKNRLWNQLRADVTGIPVKATDMKEATARGAAMVAFTGTGVFASLAEAMAAMKNQYTVYEPGQSREVYSGLYREYQEYVKSNN